MREIKFRCWDKKYKEMGSPVDLLYALKDAKNIHDWDDLIFMLYTGLKDKNGKEIYEGDILKYRDFFGEKIYELYWDYTLLNNTHVMTIIANNVEILGNIYENPELLEKING